MRTREDLQRAHDMLAQLLDGELPSVELVDSDEQRLVVATVISTLCWVIGDDHAEGGVSQMIEDLRCHLATRGFDQLDLNELRN